MGLPTEAFKLAVPLWQHERLACEEYGRASGSDRGTDATAAGRALVTSICRTSSITTVCGLCTKVEAGRLLGQERGAAYACGVPQGGVLNAVLGQQITSLP